MSAGAPRTRVQQPVTQSSGGHCTYRPRLGLHAPHTLIEYRRGYINYQTDVCLLGQREGRHCCLDTCEAALGYQFVTAAKMRRIQKAQRPDDSDCSISDFQWAVDDAGKPFLFLLRPDLNWRTVVNSPFGAILIGRFALVNEQTGLRDYHFMVIDLWRRFILTNSEKHPIPMGGLSSRHLLEQLAVTYCDHVL
jgi:hypothetical protein